VAGVAPDGAVAKTPGDLLRRVSAATTSHHKRGLCSGTPLRKVLHTTHATSPRVITVDKPAAYPVVFETYTPGAATASGVSSPIIRVSE
jgi:hypothetical protein